MSAHHSSELEVLVCRKNWAEIEAIDQGSIRVLDMIDVSPDWSEPCLHSGTRVQLPQ